ncbi:AAA family ATPase [Psychroserpens mesophilus]|uniref:AAA family ATPase n=1 Tax=Psychroserpens mesophilus TaxID=325473 RepID=UPI003D65FA0B
MSTISEIAEELKNVGEYVRCVYAFNGTGKTRLSVAYKDLTKVENDGNHAGVYYNAYSEDLFNWDNDEPNDNVGVKLEIKQSSLNVLYNQLTDDLIEEQLLRYNPTYKFELIRNANEEIGVDAVRFFKEDTPKENIKISSGETRIFVWSFFLTLFKNDGWADQQDAHFFIDDPISSLDDNNIFLTADTLVDIVEENFETDRDIIITTHHIGLFSVLYDRFKYGEKSGRYKNNSKFFMLKKDNNELELKPFEKEVFLYHLHLFKTLDEANNSQLYTYHFVLLRQLIEYIASFLGKSQLRFVLEEIKVDNPEEKIYMLNSMSHKKVFVPQISKMNENEEKDFKEIFDKLLIKYNFRF